MSDYCVNFTGLATNNPDLSRNRLLVARTRCKMWNCTFCAKKNRSIWRAHIFKKVQGMDDKTWYFVTLTAHKNSHATQHSILNLQGMWKRLYDRLRRWQKMKVEYIRVYELHESEEVHFHAIITLECKGENKFRKRKGVLKPYHPIAERWFKDNCAECGGGYICHAAKINEGEPLKVVMYITKYFTKSLSEMPKGIRRIQTSRAIGSPKSTQTGELWEFTNGLTWRDVIEYRTVMDVSIGEEVTIEYFQTEPIYPPKSVVS